MQPPKAINWWTKLAYGSGELGPSSIGMMRALFYAIYLTDTVGLDPRLASLGAIVGLFWDAINDPFIGSISDRVRTRWGRRRPFLLLFALPYGATFVLLWSAPRWESELALTLYVTLAFMLVDTISTLVTVPYSSLIPELAQSYDERTSLAGFRTAFQLIGSLAAVISAPLILDAALVAGLSQREGYMISAGLFGGLGAFFFLVVFLVIREQETEKLPTPLPMRRALKVAWENIPFRFVVGIYLLNWTAIDMVAVVFPFFLLYWVASGELLTRISVLGMNLSIETAFFGLLMLVNMLSVPFWLWVARRRSKRDAYLGGMLWLIFVLLLIAGVRPGEYARLLILGALAGFGVSAAYVLPEAMFPDIIEWDELRARQRQEGIYYGARAFIRKLTTALVIFLVLQLLGWSGYRNPTPNSLVFAQPDQTLAMIRLLISGASGMMLLAAAVLAWFNPMTREKNARIRRLLDRRNGR